MEIESEVKIIDGILTLPGQFLSCDRIVSMHPQKRRRSSSSFFTIAASVHRFIIETENRYTSFTLCTFHLIYEVLTHQKAVP